MDLGLSGRCFIVTGGTRGLGFATARQLLAEGASVVVSSRQQESVDAAVARLDPRRAVGLIADLADPSAPERLTAAAMARFGRLDGALISVGAPPAGSVMTTTDEQWRLGVDTVLLGGLRMARAAATATSIDPARMTGEQGAILMVLSSSAKSPIPGLSVSNALRPGLLMAIKDLADEVGPRGVRVNGILPGRIATERLTAREAKQAGSEALRRRQRALIPLHRYGQPEEFGRAAAFLLSPAASYITGTGLLVDGGATRAL